MNYNFSVSEFCYVKYDLELLRYNKLAAGDEMPDAKYDLADRMRYQDLAFEYGGYVRVTDEN